MKPPKNFYSNLDRRKQGLPELPEATSSDAGKVLGVAADGSYDLVSNGSLPEVTSDDNNKTIQVINGEWTPTTALSDLRIVITNNNKQIVSSSTGDIKISRTGTSMAYTMLAQAVSFSFIRTRCSSYPYNIYLDDNGTIYNGFTISSSDSDLKAFVSDISGNLYIATVTSSRITVTPISSVKYYEITASGSSVSLPSGVTFAEVYAELLAGVDVKFTSGARVYTVTSFESTNIRAHWMTDLDLTSMEVYVINLASDGTGTVASATFSGS